MAERRAPTPTVLVTTTSFQDTPGPHHELLSRTGWNIRTARGPLPEEEMLNLITGVDGLLCGDDAITEAVLKAGRPTLRVVSKYGIGVDKIDVDTASRLGIPVCYTPGVNHTTVAEHTFALLLAMVKNLVEEVAITRSGGWKRLIGHEIAGKTLGIVGLGRIGREVAARARAFELEVLAFDTYWPEEFAATNGVVRAASLQDLLTRADIVSLHTNLTAETRGMINSGTLARMKEGVIVINCARGELVDTTAMAEALASGQVGGYGTDVLETEPPSANHPLLSAPNCIVTPHIASRTYESVVRQATMSVENLVLAMEGKEPLAKVN
ncbi:MAG: phosphoglycerate dehydrogenase [Alkalispirochaeta sp.]